MINTKKILTTLTLMGCAVFISNADALVFTFGLEAGIDTIPVAPYTESGFTVDATNEDNGIFSAALNPEYGFTSNFFAYNSPSTEATITEEFGASFSLSSIELGSFEFDPAEITLTGYFSDLSTDTLVFSNITTATVKTINWTDLTSVVITGDINIGFDNIVLNQVPEPSAFALFAGLLILVPVALKRVRKN